MKSYCIYSFCKDFHCSIASQTFSIFPFTFEPIPEVCQFSSVQFSRSVVSNSLWPHGPQHTGLLCPPPSPRVYSNSCPLSQWYHLTIPSSATPISFCLQSFPASGSFPVSRFFKSGGQSIGASASTSVLPMTIQDWFPLGWTGWIHIFSTCKSPISSFSV